MKKVYLDEIEEKAGEIISFSKNNINEKIVELKESTNGFIWQGLGHSSYVNGYNARLNKVMELNNNMTKIAEYLLRVREDYDNANHRIDNAYNELLDEFESMRGV